MPFERSDPRRQGAAAALAEGLSGSESGVGLPEIVDLAKQQVAILKTMNDALAPRLCASFRLSQARCDQLAEENGRRGDEGGDHGGCQKLCD